VNASIFFTSLIYSYKIVKHKQYIGITISFILVWPITRFDTYIKFWFNARADNWDASRRELKKRDRLSHDQQILFSN